MYYGIIFHFANPASLSLFLFGIASYEWNQYIILVRQRSDSLEAIFVPVNETLPM